MLFSFEGKFAGESSDNMQSQGIPGVGKDDSVREVARGCWMCGKIASAIVHTWEDAVCMHDRVAPSINS